ncbi:MAG: plasmid stabilization protein [Sulfurovum sp.]
MQIDKTPKLTKNEIDEVENIFKTNPYNPSLHFKLIVCKKDKSRYSIRVPNSQYRILITLLDDIAYLVVLVNHSDYDKNNKDC